MYTSLELSSETLDYEKQIIFINIVLQVGAIPIFQAAEVGNFAVCKELLSSAPEQQLTTQRKVTPLSGIFIVKSLKIGTIKISAVSVCPSM